MRLTPTEEQSDFARMLAEIFADNCPTSLVRSMKDPGSDGYPAELWKVLAQSGLFGLAVEPEYGGDGAGLYELGLVFNAGGAVLCPTAVYTTLQFAVALGRLGTPDQKRKYLGPLSAGALKATVLLSNPSDAADLRPLLIANRCDGGWRVSGTIDYVPNGMLADVLLITATTDSTTPSHIGLLVEPGGAGLEMTSIRTMAGDKTTSIIFDDRFVMDDAVVAGPHGVLSSDDHAWAAHAIVALQCMEMVGGATAVIARTVEYVKVRHQFGTPIASFQAVQHHVADMHIALAGARLTAHQVTSLLAKGRPQYRAIAVAKMKCSETFKQITLTAHQLHGGMGYVRETDLHLWSERAKVTEVQFGTADIAAGWLERQLDSSSPDHTAPMRLRPDVSRRSAMS